MKLHRSETRPILYLSGAGAAGIDEDALYDAGSRYRCFSYAYCCKGAFYFSKREGQGVKRAIELGAGVMMDSSAFSFHQFVRKRSGKHFGQDAVDKLREETIERYVDFVKKKGKHWDFYVNFDYIKHCPTIYEMQKRLEKEGIRPVPVYHGDSGLEWLTRYCKEGYKLICIGKDGEKFAHRDRRNYFDAVFNIADKHNVLLHGLGETSLSFMYSYPFYSVDSASWAKYAAYGLIVHIDYRRNKIGSVHITDRAVSSGMTAYHQLPKHQRSEILAQVKENGYDFKELQKNGRQRSLYNVYLFCNKFSELKEVISRGRTRWKSLLS